MANKDEMLARRIERLGNTLLDIVAKARFYAAQFEDQKVREEALRKFDAVRKREG